MKAVISMLDKKRLCDRATELLRNRGVIAINDPLPLYNRTGKNIIGRSWVISGPTPVVRLLETWTTFGDRHCKMGVMCYEKEPVSIGERSLKNDGYRIFFGAYWRKQLERRR